MKVAPEKAPRLTRHELGKYIICDHIDDLHAFESAMFNMASTVRAMRRQAENALAALNTEKREDKP